MQLEEYEAERPPFYNKSTLAPDLNFSAESLRHDAKALAKVLISFMAFAIRTHGTTNSCVIGVYGRFELWPNRPPEANSLAVTILNEKNIVYAKALKYATRDLEDRGIYVRKFLVKPDKKGKAMLAEWSIQMSPITTNTQYPHHQNSSRSGLTSGLSMLGQLPSGNELVRLHHVAHSQTNASSRPQSRTNSIPMQSSREGGQSQGRTPSRSGPSGPFVRKSRKPDETNEFGYYGNNCTIM